jgi:hypothetical protein
VRGLGLWQRTSQELFHLVDEGLALERLRDVTIGADRAGARLVEGLECASEEQHRDVLQRWIGLDRLADLVAVSPRHHDVREDDIRPELPGAGDGVLSIVDRGDLEVLSRERDAHDLLDRDGIIREEEVLGHGLLGGDRAGARSPQSSSTAWIP